MRKSETERKLRNARYPTLGAGISYPADALHCSCNNFLWLFMLFEDRACLEKGDGVSGTSVPRLALCFVRRRVVWN